MSDQLKRNTRPTFIAGDFNAVIADGNKYYPKNIGSYSKGFTNENGPFLIDFIIQNNLYATNTFFKHLYTNITTWQNNNYPAHRQNQFRHQMNSSNRLHFGTYFLETKQH